MGFCEASDALGMRKMGCTGSEAALESNFKSPNSFLFNEKIVFKFNFSDKRFYAPFFISCVKMNFGLQLTRLVD